MKARIEKLKRKQEEIEGFFNIAKFKPVTGSALRKWIVDAVTHFSELGMNAEMISLFLGSCKFGEDEHGRTTHGIFKFNVLRRGYVLKYEGRQGEDNPYIVPVQVALSISRVLLEKIEEEERIIPLSIIRILNTAETQHIKNAFVAIETNFQDSDPQGMVGPLISATEALCKLIPELKDVENVSACLKKLFEGKDIYERYFINRDIIWALNNARIIRNEKVAHPKVVHDGLILMSEAVGYAHLLVLFSDSLLASGLLDLKTETAKTGIGPLF